MKLFNRSLSILLLAGLLAAVAVPAFAATETFALDPNHTQVHVNWNHFGFSNPGATFDISKGTLIWDEKDPTRSSVKVTIPVASVDTQVPALDARFKSEFFEVNKYPTITFRSTSVNRIGLSNRYRVRGKLTVHGVTRPVTLHATLNKIGEQPMLHAPAIGFDATATIKRSEFGLSAYIPVVSDLVRIHITAEGVEAAALAREEKAIKAEGHSK
ncbi:MAG TPA: YceI family protein [Gammaproteobacteria bacterium]|nr:YceI family protein [Gammaproteobacteria bacterium]